MDTSAKEQKKLLHNRNKHRSRYDFALLVKTLPTLRNFVIVNPYGDESLDFSDPAAVKMLNKALLKQYYDIEHWDIPENYLCPPIPGRADYIHYLADLLAEDNEGKIPTGKAVKILDVGVGANCVYPIIGHQEYGWTFVGSEIDKRAVEAAKNIVTANANLKDAVSIRLQNDPQRVFLGVVKPGETFDITMCNPPFHASAEEAAAGSQRKLHNLGKQKKVLNFGGQGIELWCKGGEVGLIETMIQESVALADQVKWFTTLVSKSANLEAVNYFLRRAGVLKVKTVEMAQGQKISRFVAWSFQK
ncbi:23S rRNA (adenine1618-N6)-methyltransferase [Pedobacter sp. CG_S7]|uniref:23S rRNA (adenine(1618)-N(6))-methyltransferase RlmF n=1 Tax=Pedobacter sp. CG_S7 TaxID=3143930 RepID=UPI0033979B7D